MIDERRFLSGSQAIALIAADERYEGERLAIALAIVAMAHPPTGTGLQPSSAVIAKQVGVETQAVRDALSALRRDGFVRYEGLGPYGRPLYSLAPPDAKPRPHQLDTYQRQAQLDECLDYLDTMGLCETAGIEEALAFCREDGRPYSRAVVVQAQVRRRKAAGCYRAPVKTPTSSEPERGVVCAP